MKCSLFVGRSTLAFTIMVTISKIEEFKKAKGRLPESLSEAGAQDDESCPCYCKTGDESYFVWYGTALGESDTYDSETRKRSPGNRACVAQRLNERSGQAISPENEEERNCACAEHLKESQMSTQVEHIEMGADLMGSHVNVKGIALMEVAVDKDGRVLCLRALWPSLGNHTRQLSRSDCHDLNRRLILDK